jgi:hypothetical protein
MFRQLRRLPAELEARIASGQPTIRGLNDGMSYWAAMSQRNGSERQRECHEECLEFHSQKFYAQGL